MKQNFNQMNRLLLYHHKLLLKTYALWLSMLHHAIYIVFEIKSSKANNIQVKIASLLSLRDQNWCSGKIGSKTEKLLMRTGSIYLKVTNSKSELWICFTNILKLNKVFVVYPWYELDFRQKITIFENSSTFSNVQRWNSLL